jgi:hypothetical protein
MTFEKRLAVGLVKTLGGGGVRSDIVEIYLGIWHNSHFRQCCFQLEFRLMAN